jgi:glycosyltransferase involved in cell wall biosynthesis
MSQKKNIILCGNPDKKVSPSWGGTFENISIEFAKQTNLIGIIDYSLKNRLLNKIHSLYSNTVYGGISHRDNFDVFFTEKKFAWELRYFDKMPDAFIHISGMCIPASLTSATEHYNYADATIFGSIRYNNQQYPSRLLKIFKNNTLRYSHRLQAIFTFNEWTRESWINDFGINENKVINVGFGANLKPYFGEKEYDNKLILTVLRRGTEKNKGLYLLLEAFKIAYKKDNKLKLAVVGTTQEEIKGVEYFENCPREKTIELFQKASVFAMPAFFEPNGMVFPEALACKTPIIGLNRLAFPEFSGNGQFGFITEPEPNKIAETILEALSTPELLKEMGCNGQKYVIERYNWSNVVARILKIVNGEGK